MRVGGRVVLVLLIASGLLVAVAGPAAASGDRASGAGNVAASPLAQHGDDPDINVTQEFSLTPDSPGEVRVELRFDVPSQVISLRTTVPEDANVTDAEGFSNESGREYAWDGATSAPTLTYALPVNESINDTSPENASGDAIAVDAGEWALFQRPPTPVHWENYATEEPMEFNLRTTTAGPGATGEWLVFLGEHETYERSAGDQRFRLVVPSNANMTSPPDTVLDSLTRASDVLRVGDRDDEVFVVAAPTKRVEWGVRGLQTGDADLWVRDSEPVASPENAWVHEYVHSRQAFALGPELQWFREASASYYAALLTYEQNYVTYEEFSARIGTGANSSYDDAVLANQSTWQTTPHYDKGALVVGQIDRQIRNERDEERTLQTVFRAMNERSGRTTLSEFLSSLGEHGSERTVSAASRYVETAENVSMWNQTAHVMAFGDPPARIGFYLPNESNDGTYRIDGPYRNATVGGDAPLVVVPGERVRADAVVANTGGSPGNYTAALAVNDTVVDRENGSVAPNETDAAVLTHRFSTPGTYRLGLDGDEQTVVVREPAEARVTGLAAPSRQVRENGTIEVGARVENDADVPGETTLLFRQDDELIDTESARVGPASTAWVNATVPVSGTGTTTVTVDGAGSVTVQVRAPPSRTAVDGTATDAPDGPTTQSTTTPETNRTTHSPTERRVSGGTGPGFETVTVAAAVVLGLTLVLLRQRR